MSLVYFVCIVSGFLVLF